MSLYKLTQLFAFLLFLLSSSGTQAQSRAAALDRYFTLLYKNGDFNGNVLVAENGRIVYEKSFGYADLSAGRLNTAATSFPVASITKTMVSTSILQLQEKGRLQITDAYSNYFPAFPYPSVTIKELLSHTSRLPAPAFYQLLDSMRRQAGDTFYTNADVIPALVALNKPLLNASPGGRPVYAYSNLNYYLLALLIEKLSGMPYAAYLKKNIFLPAGMSHTSLSEFYFGLDSNECREQRYRYLYSEKPERVDTATDNAYIFATYNLKGHGDVVSTLRDLLSYDQALYNGELLQAASLQLAYTPVVPGSPSGSGYGLGWSIPHDSSGGKTVLHHGGGLGIEAMLVRNTDRRQTVILFDNMKNPAFDKAINALKLLNGKKVALPRQSIAKAYGRTLSAQGIPAARRLLDQLKKDTLHYALSEYEMNLLAYQLLWSGRDSLAYEVFHAEVALFPRSWNVYDGYGEILLKMGRREEAIKMYERSLELNPGNENGKKMLERIRKE